MEVSDQAPGAAGGAPDGGDAAERLLRADRDRRQARRALWRQRGRRSASGANAALAVALAAVLTGMLNYAAYKYFPQRWNISSLRYYALSDKTRSMLREVRGSVRCITVFRANSALGEEMRRLLDEYVRAAADITGLGITVEPVDPDRDLVRTGMTAAGFGQLAPDTWIAPGGHPPAMVPGRVLTLDLAGDAETARALAARVWPLDRMAAAYTRFLVAFTPVRDALAAGRAVTGLDALAARVLLVHEFRRIVLRDPLLPAAILPPKWPGAEARALCADLYTRVLPASERWLDQHGLIEPATTLPPARGLEARFRA